jgi:hypothetical protein
MFGAILTATATIFPSVVYRLVLIMKTDSVLRKHEMKPSAVRWNEAACSYVKWTDSGHRQPHVKR